MMRLLKKSGGRMLGFRESRLAYFKANDPDKTTADYAKLFEDLQLSPVDVLFERDDNGIDLEAAENFGLIQTETREKIEAIPDHQGIFKAILAKESQRAKNEEDRRVAFRRAFRFLVNRAAYEEETGLRVNDSIDKPLMAKLKSVLRYGIDDHGIKRRSELQVASRELRMMMSGLKFTSNEVVLDLKVSRKTARKKVEKLQLEEEKINDFRGKINEMPPTQFDQALDQIDTALAFNKENQEALDHLGKDQKRLQSERFGAINRARPYVNKMKYFDGWLEKFASKLQYYEDTDEIASEARSLSQEARELSEKYRESLDAGDAKAWKSFLERDLAPFVKKINSKNFLKSHKPMAGAYPEPPKEKSLDEIISGITDRSKYFWEDFDSIENYFQVRGEVIDNTLYREDFGDANITNTVEREDEITGIISGLDQFEAHVQSLKNSKFAKGLSNFEKLCNEYLKQYGELKTKPTKELPTLLRPFIDTIYKTFIAEVAELFGPIERATRQELSQGVADLQGLTARIEKIEKYDAKKLNIDHILAKAFARKKTDSEIEGLERIYKKEDSAYTELKNTYDYFAGSREVNLTIEAYNQFASLIAKCQLQEEKSPDGKRESFQAKKFSLEAEHSAIHGTWTMRYPNQRKSNDIEGQVKGRFQMMDKAEINAKFDSSWQKYIATHTVADNDEDKEKAIIRKEVEDKERDRIRDEITVEETKSQIKAAVTRGRAGGEAKRQLELFQGIEAKAKEVLEKIRPLLEKIEIAQKTGIVFRNQRGEELNFAAIKEKFDRTSIGSDDFAPEKFGADFAELIEFFRSQKNIDGVMEAFDEKKALAKNKVEQTKKDFDDAQADKLSGQTLTDSAAAMKIFESMISVQIEAGLLPPMTDAQLTAAADKALKDSLAMMHSADDYEGLARRGSAELMDTVEQTMFKQKLLGIRIKDGDKTISLFKNMKPADFKDLTKLQNYFDTGRLKCDLAKFKETNSLEHVSAFVALAAFQLFDEGKDKPSEQAVFLEEKIREALANTLGVQTKLGKAGVQSIISELFAKQLAKIKPRVAAFFQQYDADGSEWNSYKLQELKLRYEVLVREHRIRKDKHRFDAQARAVDNKLFKKGRDEIKEEAEAYGIEGELRFLQDSVLAENLDTSVLSHWAKDAAYKYGKFIGQKAKAKATGSVRNLIRSAFEKTKSAPLGAVAGGWHMGRSMFHRFRRASQFLKYAALAPAMGIRNLFTGGSLKEQLKTKSEADKAKVNEGLQKVQQDREEGKKKRAETTQANIDKTRAATKELVEAVKVDDRTYAARMEEELKTFKEPLPEFAGKAEIPVIDGSGVAVDLEDYKKKIESIINDKAEPPKTTT